MATRPRGPGATYFVLTLVIIVFLTTFALTQRPPPPPTIAEFAPQAVENITDAPSDQSSSSGRAGGAGGTGPGLSTAATATPTRTSIEVARVRKCVGDPPRQIEDPQSPPCVPYWSGDNGGATWKGVTRDTITVVLPSNGGDALALIGFFNKRFEFYGRRIVGIDTGGEVGSNDEQQTADAANAADKYGAFASIHNGSGDNLSVTYAAELARRGILYTTHEGALSARFLRSQAPYTWTYPMAPEEQFANLGAWACSRLAGARAVHGGPEFAGTVRSFGIMLTMPDANFPIDSKALEDKLTACGSTAKEVFRSNNMVGADARNAVLRMRTRGVTSIFCLCLHIDGKIIAAQATNQAYYPEWLVTSYITQDDNFVMKGVGMQSDQRTHLFGLTVQPKQVRPDKQPAVWARKEVESTYQPSAIAGLVWAYRNLLLLASGIQMAGPKLTPATFAGGLHRTEFPNPDTPIMAGKAGFRPDRYSMTTDSAQIWWNESAQDPITANSTGAFCYVDGGTRQPAGDWPPGPDAYFRLPCDSGMG